MLKAALFGVPRSGTTWLGELMNSHPKLIYRFQPLFSYEFKSALDAGSTLADVESFFEQIRDASSEFVIRESAFKKSAHPAGVMFKEVRYLHLIPLLLKAGVRVVFIRRHPVDVLNSWYQAPREFDRDWNLSEEWFDAPSKNQGRVEEFYGLQGWLRAQEILSCVPADMLKFLHVIDYEILLENPVLILSEVFDFLGLEFHAQSRLFLEETTTIHKEGVYDVHRTKPAVRTIPDDIEQMILSDTGVQAYLRRCQ